MTLLPKFRCLHFLVLVIVLVLVSSSRTAQSRISSIRVTNGWVRDSLSVLGNKKVIFEQIVCFLLVNVVKQTMKSCC